MRPLTEWAPRRACGDMLWLAPFQRRSSPSFSTPSGIFLLAGDLVCDGFLRDALAGATSVEQLLQPGPLTLRSCDADVVEEATQGHGPSIRRRLNRGSAIETFLKAVRLHEVRLPEGARFPGD